MIISLAMITDYARAKCTCDCIEGGTGVSKASFPVDTSNDCTKGCIAASVSAHSILTANSQSCPAQGPSAYHVLEFCSASPRPVDAIYAKGVTTGTNNHDWHNRHNEACFDMSQIGRVVQSWCVVHTDAIPPQPCVGVETSSPCGAISYFRREGAYIHGSTACVQVYNQDDSQTRYFDVFVTPVVK